ncbi:MAG: helix-turn-helix domain-containing protein [SAR202 cluster bacterium]|nr:MerR family DNA-binding transcriptional regulator [Chloroflexota bacterium]MQG70514.1 helix-turn-helix domain-containing protein [SAR202 cluster bacterium]
MKLYRVGEFANLLDVNPRTVRRWMTSGLLSFVRLPGGERRVPHDELHAVLRLHPRTNRSPSSTQGRER